MSDKPKFPRAAAIAVAKEVLAVLMPDCVPGRCIVAGSLRRRKDQVGDVEIVYVSKTVEQRVQVDLFGGEQCNIRLLANEAIWELEDSGMLARRLNVKGNETFGPKNKLMVHVASGIPVDLFATTEESWFNYLVCRTGGAESNTEIATLAQRKGWTWNPYGPGFSRGPETHPVTSEADVFAFVGLPFREPWERK